MANEVPGAVRTPVAPKVLAVRWLARREYSRSELSQRLRQRGIAVEEIERTLDELAAAGYLSDARYAQAVVAHRVGRFGKRAIVHALKERGITAADAQMALAPLAETDELADEAKKLWGSLGGTEQAWSMWYGRRANELAQSASLRWDETNEPLAAFELADVNGKIWNVEALKGKTTFLNFWASW